MTGGPFSCAEGAMAVSGIQWVIFSAIILLGLLLGWRWARKGRKPEPYRSPALSKLPPMPGSDYVHPAEDPQSPLR